MENCFIKYQNSDIHYLRFGNPNAAHFLLTFSGYSDAAKQYQVLQNVFECANYCIIAIDLPHHGNTVWKENQFTYNDLYIIIENILIKENIQKFECMGFSYGGRLILSFLEDFAPRIERLWLLAPEGLVSKWVSAAGNLPLWVRKGLAKRLERPEKFLLLVEKLTKWGLVPTFTRSFLRFHLSSVQRRKRMFTFWLAHDEFKLKNISYKLSLLPTEVFLGEKDELFPPRKMQRFLKPFKNIRLHLIADENHQILNEKLAQYIKINRSMFFNE